MALCIAVCGAVCSVFPAMAESQPAASTLAAMHEKHDAFARNFAQTVLAILQDTKKNYADRKEILRTAFAKSVDIDWIAKFVLGATWNKANDEQRARYTALYRKYLTEAYVSNFAENPDKRIRDIKILNVTDSMDSDFNVHTQMQLADGENLKVNYLVREVEPDNYKVLDIAIENVSLITTHRSEFSKLADESGIEGVIAVLEHLSSQANPEVTLSMN